MVWTIQEAIAITEQTAWRGKSWAKHALVHAYMFGEHVGLDTLLSDVTTTDLDSYAARLEERGRSGATVNRHLASISKMFTVAVQRGGVASKPYIPRREEAEGRVRFLSKEEELALLRILEEDARDMVVLLIDTGFRLSEAASVLQAASDWSVVNFETYTITLWHTKNNKPRTVPMTKRVRAVLEKYAAKGHLMQKPITLSRFRQAWNAARKTLGYEHDKQFVPHALRHTCASRLVQAGVPLKVVQEWMGHKSIQVTERYSHLSPDNFKQAVEVLEG